MVTVEVAPEPLDRIQWKGTGHMLVYRQGIIHVARMEINGTYCGYDLYQSEVIVEPHIFDVVCKECYIAWLTRGKV